MISSFSVGNFKAFGPTQTIPIRPITLIFGPNSAGKSSIIHSLLLARHALDHGGNLDVFKTDVGGDSVDLGGFRQYVFRRNLSHAVEWRAVADVTNLQEKLRQLLPSEKVTVFLQWTHPLDDLGEPVEGASPKITSLEFLAGQESLFRLSRRPDQTLQIDSASPRILGRLAEALIAAHTIGLEDLSGRASNLISQLADIAASLKFEGNDFLPRRIAAGNGSTTSLPIDHLVALSRGTLEEDLTGAHGSLHLGLSTSS